MYNDIKVLEPSFKKSQSSYFRKYVKTMLIHEHTHHALYVDSGACAVLIGTINGHLENYHCWFGVCG